MQISDFPCIISGNSRLSIKHIDGSVKNRVEEVTPKVAVTSSTG